MKKTRVFDSMAQASAAMGVSKDFLQSAKAAGCEAFRGSRIHEADLLTWANQNHQKPKRMGPEAEVKERLEDICWRLCSLQCWSSLEENAAKYGHLSEFIKAKVNPAMNELADLVGAWKDEDDTE